MKTISLVMGILSILGMFLGFIPCLGAFNWINIPFAGIGLIISIVAYVQEDNLPKGNALAGIVMCASAAFFGFIRLFIGGGIF
ncbi:hypothetical protein NG800_007930 [Epilithonimonas ginsengisoli]|uniref:DUF4190 domain-containing protein n=1 Tax=Epilithonimonas ginsengisoli TaxID=1245592 RepID=A0ABU4JGP6_9FLAO|nr:MULTISPECIES: hypothetical protein [Chryseobacterium group]MBV6880138.1 hypothetical protein [Epilithonimonas sp. FP105]MDW8548835.1 hypothetical protein [Epilithonimonas ginsengisoli]OAH76212.1 hypothetical protein AXA65_01630 [Chryseobacterium sp. FP211-J200]